MEQSALPPVPIKRRIHPLAKWSFGIAVATIPVSLLLPAIMPALIGGGLAGTLGVIGFFAVLLNSRRYRGIGLYMVGALLAAATVGLLIPSISRARESVARSQSQMNLKQIALASHNHNDHRGQLPPTIQDSDGNPLLSWRVALLPYIEQDNLYKQFHLDEPWDSPHNRQFLRNTPRTYYSTAQRQTPADGLTYYRVFVGPGTAFERNGLQIPHDFPDGTSNTILVVEAGEPVPWTKPEELEYHPDKPLPPLGGIFRNEGWFAQLRGLNGGFNTALADGSVKWFPRSTREATLRAYITRNDGEKTEE
jgi:hypothetical protein